MRSSALASPIGDNYGSEIKIPREREVQQGPGSLGHVSPRAVGNEKVIDMGCELDTDDCKYLMVEERKESVILRDKVNMEKPEHEIFVYNEDGIVEVSKKFLKELVDFVNKRPEILNEWKK